MYQKLEALIEEEKKIAREKTEKIRLNAKVAKNSERYKKLSR